MLSLSLRATILQGTETVVMVSGQWRGLGYFCLLCTGLHRAHQQSCIQPQSLQPWRVMGGSSYLCRMLRPYPALVWESSPRLQSRWETSVNWSSSWAASCHWLMSSALNSFSTIKINNSFPFAPFCCLIRIGVWVFVFERCFYFVAQAGMKLTL